MMPRMTWTLGEPRTIGAVSDLDELGVRQLVVAGKKYDGEDLPAETRLQGTDDEYEGNLMEVTIRPVLDGETHVYDIWSYMVDSGSVFVANTTDVVAEICQFGLECGDAPLRAQLHPVMRAAKLISFD